MIVHHVHSIMILLGIWDCIVLLQYASGEKPPKFNPRPKVRLHRLDNWKTAHDFMKSVGINVKGIEPAGTCDNIVE